PRLRGPSESEAKVRPLAPTAQTARAMTLTVVRVFTLSKHAKHVSAESMLLAVSSSGSRSPMALIITVEASAFKAPQLRMRSPTPHCATAQSVELGTRLLLPVTNDSWSVAGSPLGPCGPAGPGGPTGPPAGPCGPAGPGGPGAPATPADPCGPAGPG